MVINIQDFHEILYLSIFRKYVEKIQVSLKSDMYNGYIAWLHSIYDGISLNRFTMRNVSGIVKEKIKTHVLYSVTFFSENRAFYEMWKNMLKPDRPQITQ